MRRTLDLLFILCLIVVSLPALYFVPKWQSSAPTLTTKERLELEDKNRATLMQIIAGLSIGVFFSYRTLRATDRNVNLAERNMKLAEMKYDEDLFTEVARELASEDVLTQIKGLLALKNIASASTNYYDLAIGMLQSFLQHHASLEKGELGKLRQAAHFFEISFPEPGINVQEAINTLGYLRLKAYVDSLKLCCQIEARKWGINGFEVPRLYMPLDLSGLDLGKAYFNRADLSRFGFLRSALPWSCFDSCFLVETFFQGASLPHSTFNGSTLTGANLRFVDLRWATLINCDLTDAKLEGAYLYGADLAKANKTLTQEQLNQTYGDITTKLPSHLSRPTHWDKEEVFPVRLPIDVSPKLDSRNQPDQSI